VKRLFAVVCALALLSLISSLSPLQLQAAAETRASGPLSYDVNKEVTLTGTVSSVVEKPTKGMLMGSHLLFSTGSGEVDASLGRFALVGKGALSVTKGQVVEVTGVMKTLKDSQVFMARTVKAGSTIYTIRNKRGVPLSPQTRELESRKSAGEGL